MSETTTSEQASRAEVLNRDCHCIAVERSQLDLALDRDLATGELRDRLREVQHQLFAEYVAQRTVPPSLRTLTVDGATKELKVDVRCFVYRGEIQSMSARLYRGQTTNLRTEGGGLATVFTTP